MYKVESHQLKPDGKTMAVPPRHPALAPNKAFVMAKHWPDKVYSMAMLDASRLLCPLEHAPQVRLCRAPVIQYPLTDLRFYFSWNGRSIDDSTATFITERIENEMMTRWELQETQGLIARVLRHTDTKPADVGRGVGYRKIITGLSCTHTRKVYLDKEYRVLTNWHYERNREPVAEKEWKRMLKDKQISSSRHPSILQCLWCYSKEGTEKGEKEKGTARPKGNRRHLFFFCGHPVLEDYRKLLGLLIEHKLMQLFFLLLEARAGQRGLWLYEVECVLNALDR